MNREQAIDVLETIQAFYPKVNMDKRKARILIPELEKMDYDGVMKNLSAHVAAHPYAPTLSEIATYPIEQNDYIAESIGWEEEAKKVPEEVKREFFEAFRKLVERFDGDREL